jgi:hypothetical protein
MTGAPDPKPKIEITEEMIDAAVEVLEHDPLGDRAAGTDHLVEKMLRAALSARHQKTP